MSLRRIGVAACGRIPALGRTALIPYELLDGLRVAPHSRRTAGVSAAFSGKLPVRTVAPRCAGLGPAAQALRRPARRFHQAGGIVSQRNAAANRNHARWRYETRGNARGRAMADGRAQQLSRGTDSCDPADVWRLAATWGRGFVVRR